MGAEQVLAETLLRAHPTDAAALLERAPDAAPCLASLPVELAGPVIEGMAPHAAVAVLASMAVDAAAAIVGALRPSVAAALLRRVPLATGDGWLGALPADAARRLRAAAALPAGSAVALADLRALALPGDVTVADTLARIRQAPESVHAYVYVLDRGQCLAGAVGLRDLLVAGADARLDSLPSAPMQTLPAHADAAAVLAHPAWRALRSLPVVDAEGVYLGAVHDDVRQRLERDAAGASPGQATLATALTVGEAYWLGLAGLIDGIVAAVGGGVPSAASDRSRP